jgi:hypothetical protein
MKKFFSSFVAACLIAGGSVGRCQCSGSFLDQAGRGVSLVAVAVVPMLLSTAVTKFVAIALSQVKDNKLPLGGYSATLVVATQFLYNTFIIDSKFIGERFDADARSMFKTVAGILAFGGWFCGVDMWHTKHNY